MKLIIHILTPKGKKAQKPGTKEKRRNRS